MPTSTTAMNATTHPTSPALSRAPLRDAAPPNTTGRA